MFPDLCTLTALLTQKGIAKVVYVFTDVNREINSTGINHKLCDNFLWAKKNV